MTENKKAPRELLRIALASPYRYERATKQATDIVEKIIEHLAQGGIKTEIVVMPCAELNQLRSENEKLREENREIVEKMAKRHCQHMDKHLDADKELSSLREKLAVARECLEKIADPTKPPSNPPTNGPQKKKRPSG